MIISLEQQACLWNSVLGRLRVIDSEPEPEVLAFLNRGFDELGSRGLDIGCGLGRHMLAGVQRGFDMCGVDVSREAVAGTRELLRTQGYRPHVAIASMQALPFASSSFDFAFAWCVVNHGIRNDFVQAVKEALRVLRADGHFFGFVMTRADPRYAKGIRVAADTYILTEGLEAGICHYFPDLTDIKIAIGCLGKVEYLAEVRDEDHRISRYHSGITASCHAVFQARKAALCPEIVTDLVP